MMQRSAQIYTLVLTAFVTIIAFASYRQKNADPPGSAGAPSLATADDRIPQVVKSVDLEGPFDFAGELLPMENFDVRERLDRELLVNTYWHSSTMLNIKNTYKFFPVIERILADNGIPDDFKYLAVAESSLRNETSPAGAKGFWQFMKNTGEYYGLEINSEVDERFHLEKATQAACKYILDYKKRFGSWTLAAAAYNMGGTSLARNLETQRAEQFYDLNLNDETNRYIFRLVAIKEILKNPEKFGFYLEPEEAYQPLNDYQIVEVKGPVPNWGDFAREHGTTYRMIKVYNPWLLDSNLTNRSGKTYEIRVPAK
jgi:hypothetical protein